MFSYRENNGVKYMVIDEFEETGICKSAFSTRIGGVSTGEAASMNFGFNRKDTKENITENFRLLSNAVGIDYKKLVLTDQVHNNIVRAVDENDCGNKLFKENHIFDTDGLVTNKKGVSIVTFHADCMPVFFLDPDKKAIGVAHSGWKGTTKNIIGKTVLALKENYGCNPENIISAIGPSIGTCCFEVDDEVSKMFPEKYHVKMEKTHINLWQVAKDQLKDAGIKKIISSDICTKCNNDIFYSYRGDNHKTGSMVSVLTLI